MRDSDITAPRRDAGEMKCRGRWWRDEAEERRRVGEGAEKEC